MSASTVLSFDIEEHDRIEAAAHLTPDPAARANYGRRMEACTHWILDALAERKIPATFFVVGEVANTHPKLVRRMADEGHEVASHSHDHRSIFRFDPPGFRRDLLASKHALEDVTGLPVFGFRAPTFSLTRKTAWAIDELVEAGFTYDSSIFPVRHDRYGVPDAPRVPFRAVGERHSILELPPATLPFRGANLPAAGGGYFRLFPLGIMRAAIRSHLTGAEPRLAMLYFHPWEFDPHQPKLPLKRLSSWRTYVGISRSRARLAKLMAGDAGRFVTAGAWARCHLGAGSAIIPFEVARPGPA